MLKRTQQKKGKNSFRRIAILHNVRSVHNVGTIFRTSDALGVLEVFCSGYTPSPVDMLGRTRKDFAKTALGAEKNITWTTCKDISKIIKKLQSEGVSIIAMEQDSESTILGSDNYIKGDKALLVGNEVRGISKQTLALVDHVVEIPMKGIKESLNVAVTFGIGAFVIFR